jgi:cell wall assembly regulator SMI1
MTIEVKEVLSQIEMWLDRLHRTAALGALRPGLSDEAVNRLLGLAGLPANSEVVALYSWRDGTQTEGFTLDDIQVFPGFYLLSLEDALANYRAFVTDSRWRQGWLPLFGNGGGDFYVVDLEGQPSGRVRHFRIDEAEHPVEFDSLLGMFTTLAAAFVAGVFFVDHDGYLEMDDSAFTAVAAALNPEVPWWND